MLVGGWLGVDKHGRCGGRGSALSHRRSGRRLVKLPVGLLLESRARHGEMAEWSNAPDSKSGVQVLLYRGFESLSLRHEYPDFGS